MGVLGAVARGRVAAESLMTDYGTASRPTGGYVYDDTTQGEVAATNTLFSSACKIQSRNVVASESEAGGRTVVTTRLELHLPASTAPLTVGDLFTVTTPAEGSLVPQNRVYRVTAPFEGTHKTSRRYQVERVAT